MLDYIASAIIFGVLALSVARIQSNINATLYQNTFTVITQQNAVELARQIEFDILKIGHHVRGQRIFYAAERRIQYRADIRNDMDTVNVQYLAGTITQGAITSNPRDFPLFRQEVTTNVRQNWGLIEFRITYFDSNNVQIGTPTNVADTLVKIRGINGDDDTVTVEKEFHDRAMRKVVFKRLARDPDTYWRNWIPVASTIVVGGTVEPNNNIEIVKSELFLPNGDTIVVTDPLQHFLRYRWERLLGAIGMILGHDRPPVPELLRGQQLTMRVTVRSASPDTDLVALRFGCNAFRKHRARMHLVSEQDNGDGTWTRAYEKMWTVPENRGFFHVAIDAATHGTIFDDTEPYSVSWWGVPYRVF